MAKEQKESVIISATLVWPFLTKPNDLSKKYQVDLSQLSEADVAKVESLGITLRKEGKADPAFDRGVYVTAKSSYPINAVEWNSDRTKFTEDELTSLGNGTTARVKLSYYDWTNPTGGTGRSVSILGMVVKDYVEYEASGDAFEDEMFDTDEELAI